MGPSEFIQTHWKLSVVHKPEILASSNQHPTSQGVNKDAKKICILMCQGKIPWLHKGFFSKVSD